MDRSEAWTEMAWSTAQEGPMRSYHGVILGAGHNGLILQAYLGMAGLKTVALDRRQVAGGGLSTMEDPRFPGFLHNTHAFFQRAVTGMPWYHDLDLAARGAQYIEPELNVALLTRDGRALEWWTDFDRTFASFQQFDATDAATLRRWHDDFVPIVKNIVMWEGRSPPLPKDQRRLLLERSDMGRKLLAAAELSPLEFVQREFRNPVIQAGLLFFNGLREVDLRLRGFGHHIAALLASPAKAQMCRGGSAALARALERAVRETGGEVRLMTEPARIVVENQRVKGVETTTGEFIRADFVASSLNPHQTFLDLLDHGLLPNGYAEKAASFEYNLIAPLFALNVNLSEPPAYRAAEAHPELARAFMVIMGLDHVDQFSDIVRHHESGTIPPTVMWGACPTIFDPSQAPPGRHTAFMWEKLPYRLNGDARNWDSERDAHGEHMLALWRNFAPNIADAVLGSFTRSALDVERCLPNMRGGDLLIGAFANGQIGHDRPFPGAGEYRGPFRGLYLCGSSSHPGGNITGLPGYNAAQVILADLGLPTHWAPSPFAERLARL
jgi:phytoene dehydrogenase-like protein